MRFRVKEEYLVKGWTYVEADSLYDAVKKIEDGLGDFRETDSQHHDIDWDSLESDE